MDFPKINLTRTRTPSNESSSDTTDKVPENSDQLLDTPKWGAINERKKKVENLHYRPIGSRQESAKLESISRQKNIQNASLDIEGGKNQRKIYKEKGAHSLSLSDLHKKVTSHKTAHEKDVKSPVAVERSDVKTPRWGLRFGSKKKTEAEKKTEKENKKDTRNKKNAETIVVNQAGGAPAVQDQINVSAEDLRNWAECLELSALKAKPGDFIKSYKEMVLFLEKKAIKTQYGEIEIHFQDTITKNKRKLDLEHVKLQLNVVLCTQQIMEEKDPGELRKKAGELLAILQGNKKLNGGEDEMKITIAACDAISKSTNNEEVLQTHLIGVGKCLDELVEAKMLGSIQDAFKYFQSLLA